MFVVKLWFIEKDNVVIQQIVNIKKNFFIKIFLLLFFDFKFFNKKTWASVEEKIFYFLST
jgi:hypothetical protein